MTQLQVSKWGNSSAIRLPKAVLDELGLKPGQTVELTVKDGLCLRISLIADAGGEGHLDLLRLVHLDVLLLKLCT